MNRNMLWAAVATLLLAGCNAADKTPAPAVAEPAAPVAAPAAADSSGARWQGFGPSVLGTAAAQLPAQWPEGLQGEASSDGSCYYLHPRQASAQDVALMIEADHFVRYDVRKGDRAAPGGGRIGMDLAELQALYPERAALEPHKYVEGGHNLRIAPAVAGEGIVNFEIDGDGKATAWRVGQEPQVDYVEGCS